MPTTTPNLGLYKPSDTDIMDETVYLNPNWDKVDSELSLAGTTANRPTTNMYVGKRYFDTTLGKPIWLKTISPIAWVDATGTGV